MKGKQDISLSWLALVGTQACWFPPCLSKDSYKQLGVMEAEQAFQSGGSALNPGFARSMHEPLAQQLALSELL